MKGLGSYVLPCPWVVQCSAITFPMTHTWASQRTQNKMQMKSLETQELTRTMGYEGKLSDPCSCRH